MYSEDVRASFDVGDVDGHGAIKAAGTEEGLVEDVGAIRAGEHDDTWGGKEGGRRGEVKGGEGRVCTRGGYVRG